MRVPWPRPRSPLEFVLASLLGPLAITLLGSWLGAVGLLGGMVVAPLLIAWRYDNQVGACFPLVLLFMIILTVLGLLLYLILVTH